MPTSLQIETPEQKPREPRRFPVLPVVLLAVGVAAAGIYFWPGAQKPQNAAESRKRLPFGPAEREYAPKIQIGKVALRREENFLHQEVTTVSGTLQNAGNRSLSDAELTIEFYDEMRQVVLRETRALFGGAPALAPGASQEFEVSFEHIPYSWNRQSPTVSISGLQFAPASK